mmetsp:Transcript_2032/g.3247  ORF Transcript_2032/g.3247 Transcript_2032/m.3247 type:complete len:204 (+) Transcript_2032:104-715(+)
MNSGTAEGDSLCPTSKKHLHPIGLSLLRSLGLRLGSSDILSHAVVIFIGIDCISILPDTKMSSLGLLLLFLQARHICAPALEFGQAVSQEHAAHVFARGRIHDSDMMATRTLPVLHLHVDYSLALPEDALDEIESFHTALLVLGNFDESKLVLQRLPWHLCRRWNSVGQLLQVACLDILSVTVVDESYAVGIALATFYPCPIP